jgi:Raf kinase inhibitor-like YbhB/YbcL family protein
MKIESPAFGYGAPIPEHHSRFGENRSPPLVFRDVPAQAGSLALVVDDPDAPRGTLTHWIVFNLDPSAKGLAENCHVANAREGNNDWQEPRYGGPRPPDGEHRYFFRLYALDSRLDLPAGAGRNDVDRAMEGHVIAQAEWMGRFATPVQAERDAG